MKQHELVPPDLPSLRKFFVVLVPMCPVYEKGCVVGLPPPDTGRCSPTFLVFDGGYTACNSDPEYITCCFMVSISN